MFSGVRFWQEFFTRGGFDKVEGGDIWFWWFIGFCAILGAGLGSFVCCQVRRIREKHLGKEIKDTRSICLACKNRILWYDNIPVFSWLILGGKCRKCGAKIGKMEILSEISLGVVFGVLGIFMYDRSACWVMFGGGLMTLMLVLLGLVLYDLAWKEVPNVFLVILNIIAAMLMLGRILWYENIFGGAELSGKIWQVLMSQIAAIGILAGVYYLLYKISNEKWVGSGDYLVGLAIAMVLGSPFLVFMVIFLGNLAGSVYGFLIMLKKGKSIPMVPFLALGFLGSLVLVGTVL